MSAVLAANETIIEEQHKYPRPKDRLSSEIVIGVVGPIGSGCSETTKKLVEILRTKFSYEAKIYKPSELIAESLAVKNPQAPRGLDKNFSTGELQAHGNELRQSKFPAYLAAKLIQKIALDRDEYELLERAKKNESGTRASVVQGEVRTTNRRVAHIIDSLKHPEEFELLRQTYGAMFWLIGVFAPEATRKDRLTKKHQGKHSVNDLPVQIQRYISDDYSDGQEKGQNVRDLFFQADFFVNNDQPNDDKLQVDIGRFLDSIFGAPIKTPTVEESSMYAAYAQAARSACMSRQVGASIVNSENVVIGLGRNDVPKYGGGLYDESDGRDDHRCFRWETKLCHNQKRKNDITERIEALVKPDKEQSATKVAIKNIGVSSLMEFSRSIHAEMEALLSVARSGNAGLVGSTLYTTTFPCHNCARHIVAAGIQKVVFIEPFPKSEAISLHSDSMCEPKSAANEPNKVALVQYSGFAPKRLLEIFSFGGESRKNDAGHVISFDSSKAQPKIRNSMDSFSTLEKYVVSTLDE